MITPCQDCTCGAGQGRNCKLREPRDLTKTERLAWLLFWSLWAMAIVAVLTGCSRDDSDPPGGHSGFDVYRDNLTGCEYVGFSGLWGKAITPRLGRDGKQVCREVGK